nr:hypothetical protein [Faecalibacterium sp. AM43-5AT]
MAAFLFPIPLTYLMTTPSMMERYTDRADAFDWHLSFWEVLCFLTVQKMKFSIIIIISFSRLEP